VSDPGDVDAEPRDADGGAEHRTNLADRRTSLANERTLLAWWRTGLTSLAVALGVGRLLPELAHGSARWPFVVIGVAFALYGIAFFLYGTRRSGERGGVPATADPALAVLTASGVVLGIASAVLILTQ
jgi:putative membrane protein